MLGLGAALTAATRAPAEPAAWSPVGPFGGEVRALAADPRDQRIVYLGTAEGVLFRSADGGRRWSRLEPGFPLRGMSLDNIAVDRTGRVAVGYWEVAGSGGGVALSADGGRHFELGGDTIAGESVRALALSPSDPDTWVAGTLSGVFRTRDAGASWRRISPVGDDELRNVESVAVDPAHPDVIYAGTWHLPWKTRDGGRSWAPVAEGMIDDSDVFTMTVDWQSTQRLYATACTGIYSSSDGGERWSKVRGIPSSSRRTRSFAQDPERPEVLYAGTTEGLWGTRDGSSWQRLTRGELIVNAVLALRGGVVLLGTEEDGVLRSEDGVRWDGSNDGFSAHFVTRLLYHPDGSLLAGLHGGRYHGGVLRAERPGGPWQPWGNALANSTVLFLAAAGDGALAGTDDGIFFSEAPGLSWRRLSTVLAGVERRPVVRALASPAPGVYLAATDQGLLRSDDSGASWLSLPLGSARRVTSLTAAGGAVLAATPLGLYRSEDEGRSWKPVVSGPAAVIVSLHVPRDVPHVVFAVTEEGLYKSHDGGNRFSLAESGLPRTDLTGFAVSPDGKAVWLSDFQRAALYLSSDGGGSWTAQPTAGLMPARVWDVAVDPAAPERVLVATAGGGLHALLNDAAVVSEVEPVPLEDGGAAVAVAVAPAGPKPGNVAPAKREEEP